MGIATPPPTSLSPTVSPTTSNPSLSADMPSIPAARPLYLVVATSLSPPLGIGLKGTLPWPAIKSDMSFFARVTKRTTVGTGKNIVVMGRKTYESVPAKFRPLVGRKNIVVTRSDPQRLQAQFHGELQDEAKQNDVICVCSLREAVNIANTKSGHGDKVFVIGGSQIYQSSLEENYHGAFTHLRILQTEVQRNDGAKLEIDTFFPLDVQRDSSWRKAENREVAEWVGEEVPQVKTGDGSWKEDGDFKIRILGWEKELPLL